MVKKVVAAIFMCAVMVLVAAVPLALADTHTILKGEKGPRASAMTWEYVPATYGVWTGHIVNNGLRSLVVDVYDNSTGMPEEILHQKIRFAVYDAYPIGTVDTTGVIMAAGRLYEITVTPNGPKGATCTVEDMFKSANPPVAVITVVSVDFLNVAVSGSLSYDTDGTIVSYEWDFGDGSTAMGVTASHTYAKDGTYTVTLLVTDNEGLNGSATEQVTVQHELVAPVAKFTATMDWMVVSVDGSASTDNYGPIASYDWDFGDGLTGTGVTASHVYAVEGLYTITLTVTDSDGMTGMASMDVQAKMEPVNQPPVAMITATIVYLNVAVDGSGSYDPDPAGSVVSHAWNFGDGSSATGPTASHTYAADGTYTITLTVKDDMGATGSATEMVTVQHEMLPPVASFTADILWMTVSVDASASTDNYGPIASYDWEFGDGMTDAGVIATHIYSVAGTYTITLTVTDSDGQTGSASKDVTAVMKPVPVPPVAVITATVDYLNVAVDGSGSSDADGTIVSYAWTFGDGSIATGMTATHSYALAGTYTITLTVKDNDGLTGTDSKPVTVVAPPIPPVAVLSVTSQKYLDVAVSGSGSYDLDGTIVSYDWTFGDGSIATGMTATHSYALAGTYTITLKVTDNDGLTGTDSKQVTVGPAIPPVAVLSVTSQKYLDVAVSGSGSYDLDGTIVSFDWTFGDGSIATGMTATHSYALAGTYTITLKVTDNDGLTGTATKQVTVVAAQPPVAVLSVTSQKYLDVAVSGSGSSDADGTIVSYAWTFGDGSVATGVTATHSYAAAGTYTITLKVTDNDGLTGTATKQVTVVAAQPPVAVLSVTSQKYLDVAVSGSGSSDADGTIVSYAWTFGDGSSAIGMTATHSYALAGTYTITLKVTDNDGLTGTATKQVTVVAAIPPVAVLSVTSQKYLDVAVSGSGSSDADGTIVSYAWTFGDGSSAIGMTATHSYALAGTYTITLKVTDNDGLTGTATKQVTVVAAQPPVAVLSVTSQKYLDVAVSGSGSYDADGTIVSYAWTFGDGSVATGMTATHSYALAGTYIITLKVTDNDGLTGTATKQVTVGPAIPPVAVLSVTSQKYLDVAVSGSGSSDPDGTIVSYAWTFGDGSTATGVTASHSYAAAGTYTITLKVTDNDGLTGTATKQVTVVAAQPPVAVLSVTSQKYLDVAVSGSGSSDADGTIVSYAWTFGDGSVATGMTATHSYALAGTYTITLKVTDNDGLTGTATKQVTVVAAIPPVASWSWTQKYLNVAVSGSGSSDADGTIVSYAWTFGDGSVATGMTATHSYALAGTYTITLKVTDNDGLNSTASGPVTVVAPIPPVAVLSVTSQKYLDVAVSGSGSYDLDGTIASYAWTFGDGSSATGVTATHSYAAAGTYTIVLTVTDNDGLTGSKSQQVTVVAAQPPVARFTPTVSLLNVAVDASASSDADGTIVSYAWTFGDGSVATGVTASHSYAAAGTYTITLKVTDNDGLTGSASQPVTVSLPPPPTASFTVTASGLTVNVDASASSGSGLTYAWAWGDGTTGTGVTATHTYTAKKAAVHVVGARAPPGTPHAVFGFTTDSLSNPINGCIVAIKDKRTGESIIWDQNNPGFDPNSNIYSVDLSELKLGWTFGDILNVTATQGTWIGWTEAPITDNINGYDQIDVILHQAGPAPFDVTITLTVTDSLGRTATMSKTMTLYP